MDRAQPPGAVSSGRIRAQTPGLVVLGCLLEGGKRSRKKGREGERRGELGRERRKCSEEGVGGLVVRLDMEINNGKITWALIILFIRPKMAGGEKKGNCIQPDYPGPRLCRQPQQCSGPPRVDPMAFSPPSHMAHQPQTSQHPSLD